MKYKVFLPQTPFSLRVDHSVQESSLLPLWNDLYLQLRNKSNKKFILHDGPPYANGEPHMGHVLNRVLKDVVVRTQQMLDKSISFVPGWDCHGLPIEWKVEEKFRIQGRSKESISREEFRKECRNFAEHWIEIQKKVFQKLGTIGDWDNPYLTFNPEIEAIIISEIWKFLLNGSLYRGEKPVLWSTVEKTALAEAEVEYHDKESSSIYIAFPVINTQIKELENGFCVIWTTTPWTIPANRAIAYGEELEYAVVKHTSGNLLIAFALIDNLRKEIGELEIIKKINGNDLEGTICSHPFKGSGYEFNVPLLPGKHVVVDSGTGLVHTAPSHGIDDFEIGKKYNLEIPKVVNESGFYFPEVPVFNGKHIFKVNDEIISLLKEKQCLLFESKIKHSYPHSWRSKAPLIYRTTPQWFIKLNEIKQKALEEIKKVNWVPKEGYDRIRSFIENRADWCVSRQRVWGVPIAIFVNKKTQEPLKDEQVMKRIIEIVKKEGSDAWFSRPAKDFLGNDYNPEEYEQIFDIIDVWFESGCSHAYVLEKNMEWPADLYLEGSDQHRGWFQSSLLASCGTRSKAPYKTVLTHGFLVDENGHKMSKSLGNVLNPESLIQKLGTDVLRLWAIGNNYTEDIRVSQHILKQQEDVYKRLRNTLKYLLGSLNDFSGSEHVAYKNLPELEKWILHKLSDNDKKIRNAINKFAFNEILTLVHTFCTVDLSAFYFDIRKDCLYCDHIKDIKRRSTRTVLNILFEHIIRWLAPILVFTAEEAWLARDPKRKSVHSQLFLDIPRNWYNPDLNEKWEKIKSIRKVITCALEKVRTEIKSNLQARIEVFDPKSVIPLIENNVLAEIAIVSDATIRRTKIPEEAFILPEFNSIGVMVYQALGKKCERCWRILPEVCDNPHDLCQRCLEVLSHT